MIPDPDSSPPTDPTPDPQPKGDAPPVADQPAADPAPPTTKDGLWAGKYADAQQLEQGFNALYKHLGLPPTLDGKPLVGDGGVYANHTELEAAHKNLEKMQGHKSNTAKPAEAPKPTPEPVKPKPGDMPGIPEPAPANDPYASLRGVEKVMVKAGFDTPEKQAALRVYWAEHGSLAPEHYDAFQTKADRDSDEINTIFGLSFDNSKIRAATAERTMANVFGGPEAYQTVLAWSRDYYQDKPAVRADINARLGHQDSMVAESAAQQILNDYKRDTGTTGSHPLVKGNTPAQTDGGSFTAVADFEAAQGRLKAGTASDTDKAKLNATYARPDFQKFILS